ncbi:MAG: DNA repair protein RecN, partial [Spirochaetales bacterium]
MLEELTIRDFAIIDRLSVRFDRGLNLLTGETGAGKSILIGALGFLLGDKADTGLIRTGSEETLVTGTVDVSDNTDALDWLGEHGIEPEDGTIIIRRGLKRTGRGSVYIQNVPVVRQDLADFASLLIEVHGQRDSQSLLKRDRHRQILDRYAGIEDDVRAYGVLYADLGSRRRLLETMVASEVERVREIELLQYAVEEIEAAHPVAGEEDELADEERRLSQHEKLYAAVSTAHELLSDTDGILVRLRKSRNQLETAQGIDQRLSDVARRVEDSYYEVEDIGQALSTYSDQLRYDPGRLEEIEARLATLQKLRRKYGANSAEVLKYRDDAVIRLERLKNWAEDRVGLEREATRLESEVNATAETLSAARVAFGAELEEAVARILTTLGMPNARFAVRMERKPLVDGKIVVGPFGADEPEFYVSANRGEPLRPLSQVASGGELSRVMLALKTVLARADGVPTMVFDEIDTGIGGEVALGVGKHLAGLAETKQVFCITHLASIA